MGPTLNLIGVIIMGFGAAAAADTGVSLINTIVNGVSAKRTRDEYWQHSEHAHEYEVRDLKKAGINPIMSAGGPGAPTSMGPTAQSNMRGNALEAYLAKSRLQIEQQVAGANIALTRANINNVEAQTSRTAAEEAVVRQNLLNNPTMMDEVKSRTGAANARRDLDKQEYRKRGYYMPLHAEVGEAINTVLQSYPGLIDHVARKIVELQRSLVPGKNSSTGLWDGKIGNVPVLVDPGAPKPGTIKYPFRKKHNAPAYRTRY